MSKYGPNSLFTWYPLIKGVVPTPKTVMILLKGEIDPDVALSGGSDPAMERLIHEATFAAVELGGYPVFLRSDGTSNKHDWKDSCYVTSDEDMRKGIANILEFTLMQMFGPGFNGVAVREFLRLKTAFTAFNGMPVAREFRFFIRGGDVLCWHPYWPPAAIRRASVDDWEAKLREISHLSEAEYALLRLMAINVADAVKGIAPDDYWSIDFCETKAGFWYVTDMALGKDSYHWSACPNSAKYSEHPDDDNPEDVSGATTARQEDERLEAWKARLSALREDEGKKPHGDADS